MKHSHLQPFNRGVIALLLLIALLFSSTCMASSLEPCSDMTKTRPLCKYGLIKNFERSVKTLDDNSNFIDVISDNADRHYMLLKVPINGNSSEVTIQGNINAGGNFNSFLDVSVKDDCGGAPIEGGSITFLNSNADILLTGWFVSQNPVCIGTSQLFPQSLDAVKNIPFMAELSSSGVVKSVTTLNFGYSIQSVYIEKTTGKRYMIMQKGSQLYLGIYQDKLILKKQIAACEDDPTKCKVLSIHYSSVYDKIVVSIFETQEFQLIINGDNKEYLPRQSALWVLLLNPDGSYVHSQIVFHSTSTVIPTPKIKFDSIGKLNIILSCESDCFLNSNAISANIFLLQYDYIKTSFSLTKNFIQQASGASYKQNNFKIHSISIERDDTIAIVMGGSSSYSIIDEKRSLQAVLNGVYQIRFRHVDGKIIHVQQLTTEYDITSNFIVSTSSPMVNSNNFVAEQNPIIYLRNNELKAIAYIAYGSRYNNGLIMVRYGGSYGGGGGSYNPSTSGRIRGIKIRYSSQYVYGFVFYYTDGSSSSVGNSNSNEFLFTLADDEYITNIKHEYRGYGFIFQSTTLACIRFFTNKANYGVNNCWNDNNEQVPDDLELTSISTKSANVIDSIWYSYGYSTTYSCKSGYTGDNCDIPICFDLEANNPNVCNGNGKCIGPNTCSCSTSFEPVESRTCLPYGFCEDVPSFNSGTCNGRGNCLYNNTCSCERGYYGTSCDVEAKCFGISKNSFGACSGHGKCLDTDTCECNNGYVGTNCEIPICFGNLANDSSVCSGHGDCVKTNICSCKTGYYGYACQSFSCNGTDSTQPSTCSSKGRCVDYNTCNCTEGFFGSNCEQFTCNGTKNLDASVCSSRGVCSTLDTCLCKGSVGANCEKCEDGYYGDNCEKWTCDGIENTSPNVCNSRGTCQSLNKCVCEYSSIKGQFCESCEIGYFGDKCNNWTCDGVLNSNSSVCNYRGVCSSYNKCECNTRSTGTYCDKCIGYYDGQSCGSCVGSHFGDECFNFLESNKAAYLEDRYFDGTWWTLHNLQPQSIYGFRVITNTNFRYNSDSIDCSRVFENVDELGSPSQQNFCTVTEIALNMDKKSYRYYIEFYTSKDGVLFNPRTPIKFNVMWSSKKDASYDIVNFDASDFLKKRQPAYSGFAASIYNGKITRYSMNRCFESNVYAEYSQPEPGTFQSITWELTGNSANLMGVKTVREAIEKAQNTLAWTFPYTPETSKYSTIDMSGTVVSNFGLKYTRNYSFPVEGSYPRQSIAFPLTKIVMTSSQVTIPMTQFFSENQECVDLRTVSFDMTSPFPDRYYTMETNEKSITFKPQTFTENLSFELKFLDGTTIPILLEMIPPTVMIKESIVVYKQFSIPSITLSCKSNYGVDNFHSPFVFLIMENDKILRRTVSSESSVATVSVPVNQLYPGFNLTSDHTFTIACIQKTTVAMASVPELYSVMTDPIFPLVYVMAKSTQMVSFIPDNRIDVSSCNVVGATLTGSKVNNVIPSLEESMTYFLDIVTSQAPFCLVDIVYISSTFEKLKLDSVAISGTRSLVPLQYQNGKLKYKSTTISNVGKYFTLSLMGASDVSDTTVPITVKEPLSNLISVKNCEISPSRLDIGFSIGKLTCSMESPISTISMSLLHEDSIVGTSFSFPISFKTTKSSNNFKIIFSDTQSGSKFTMPVQLTNTIEFSTANLFTIDVVSSISTILSSNSTTEFYKSNDLVISMISNINTVYQNNSVISEISKIIPLALTSTATSIATQLESNLAQGSVTSEDMSNYINQVKILSKPQFLTDESTSKTVDMLNKFVEVSSKAVIWSSDSSNSLSDILVNVAAKIPEQSTIKLASSIVNAAINLGTKTELTTADFFPTQKPSNLVSINAVKTSITSLSSNIFVFSNSNVSLVSFSVSSSSSVKMINVANSLFKFPTKLSRKAQDVKKEYVSQLTLSSTVSGNVHIKIPIPSYTAPTSSRTKQTFRCSLTLDFVNFDTETKCKSVGTTQKLLTDIQPTDSTLLVDCLCDLSSLSNLMNSGMFGITADYIEETLPVEEESNRLITNNDSSGAAAIVIIPILLCCGCFIAIPVIVTIIIIREKRRRENSSSNSNETSNNNSSAIPRPAYSRVVTSSTLQSNASSGGGMDFGFDPNSGMVTSPTADARQPYSVAMKTFSTFDVIDVHFDTPTTI